ncbi:hypothetical protein VNO78_19700 [Psophocarpus tetragonolobus]|uniref:Uncharacterized protein n=1 Tax=Psophocarpus tetragonolobus TaxID=3891 RepID=A0AAN9S8J7_PSOTE
MAFANPFVSLLFVQPPPHPTPLLSPFHPAPSPLPIIHLHEVSLFPSPRAVLSSTGFSFIELFEARYLNCQVAEDLSSHDMIIEDDGKVLVENVEIRVKDRKLKKESRSTKMGEALAAWAEASKAKTDRYRSKSMEVATSHVTVPDYFITKCINMLIEIEDLLDDIYVKAIEKFKEPEYREVFIVLTDARKLVWLNRI